MENQQLIKKDRSANSYSKIFPWTFTDLVLDRVTKESLDNILVRNNFIALPYVDSKAATRLQVPMKNRRRGIWLSYIDYAGTLTVEYYNNNNLDDNHWQDSSYWLPYNTAEFQPASVGLSALSQEVFDWINSQITTAVKLNPEDLQKNSSGQIEEANRAYDTSTFSGLGYRILRKNIQSNKNILTQSMINMPNTIYEIRYDFDLNGSTISIPNNCELKFAGGSFKNGTIQFNQTTFINPKFSNVRFTGSILNQQLNIDDFGAIKGDESFDNSVVINDLINLKKRDAYAGAKTIFVPSGAYYIKNSIQLYDYYNSNITLTGEGLSSVIAQVTDNIPIIKSYETTVISNLRLIYKNWQPATNTNATAIAVQRAIRSVFENLMIVDAQKGFGYVTIADQEADKITDFRDQCYVYANTRNVAIYQCSSYAIDLRKEIAQADSGSTYDNIYISSSHPINGYDETKPSIGAIYMGGSSMTFTQLNIESKYSDTLIMSTSLTNYLTIANLHIEGLTTMRPIYKQVDGQGFFDIGNIDIDRCAFTTNNLFLFYFSVSIKFNIDLITLRNSCTIPEGNQWFIFQQDNGTSYGRLGNHSYPIGMAPTRVNNSYDHIVLRIDRSDFLVTYGSQDQFTSPSKNNWLLYAGGDTLAYLYNKAIYIDDAGDYRYPDGYLARVNNVTIRRSGTTAQRPTLDNRFIGFTYYDTTINELLTWSGTGWINPDGTAISRVNFVKTITDITNLESGDRSLRIVGNIDLGGTTLTMPSNCTLDFQGGSFSNGTIIGSNTKIESGLTKIFGTDITLSGTWIADSLSPEHFGTTGIDATQDTTYIQKALDCCAVINIKTVKLQNKTYQINSSLLIQGNIKLEGATSRVWNNGSATILSLAENIVGISVESTGVEINNLKIMGNTTNTGISFTNRSYYFSGNRIITTGLGIGFDIQSSWTYIFNLCRIEGGTIGFKIQEGTSGTFNSCVAFDCTEYGFYATKLNYGSFNGCGTDGCKYGFYFTDACRGVTLSSCGCESTQVGGYMVKCGARAYVTITAFSVGTMANVDCDLFIFEADCRVSLIDLNVGSLYHPTGNTLNVARGAAVALINCYLTGNSVGLENCSIISPYGNTLKYSTTVDKINTKELVTSSLATNATYTVLPTAPLNSVYLITAVTNGNSAARGLAIVTIPTAYGMASVDNLVDNANCQISIDATGNIIVTNTSSAYKAYRVSLLKLV